MAMPGAGAKWLGAAGFNAGLMAGSMGAMGYALVCPDVSAAFVTVWYSLGIQLPGLVDALLGPWLLRWLGGELTSGGRFFLGLL